MRYLPTDGLEINAAYNVMCHLETRWVPKVSGEGREGSHPWVSYPLGKFLSGMREASKYFREHRDWRTEPKFIDVGCGIGTKVALAAQMGYRASGIDFVPEYLEAARELCPTGAFTLTDAREYDGYGEYDLIYAYRPLVEPEDEAALVRYIAGQLKPGSLMFLPWHQGGVDVAVLEDAGFDIWQRR